LKWRKKLAVDYRASFCVLPRAGVLYTAERRNSRKIRTGDDILFYEYFHGDSGAGLGASHQTGWTGLIARSLDLFARLNPADLLREPTAKVLARMTREQVAGA
jgi:hypothetical protein